MQRPQRIRRPARLHSPDLSREPLNPSWIIGSKKVSPLSHASFGSPNGSQASLPIKREQKRREKDQKQVKEVEPADEDEAPLEGIAEAPTEKLKVTSAKLLQDIIRQGGDITKIEIDEKLWKNRVQYFNLNDPFNANQGKSLLPADEDPVVDNHTSLIHAGQQQFAGKMGGLCRGR